MVWSPNLNIYEHRKFALAKVKLVNSFKLPGGSTYHTVRHCNMLHSSKWNIIFSCIIQRTDSNGTFTLQTIVWTRIYRI